MTKTTYLPKQNRHDICRMVDGVTLFFRLVKPELQTNRVNFSIIVDEILFHPLGLDEK